MLPKIRELKEYNDTLRWSVGYYVASSVPLVGSHLEASILKKNSIFQIRIKAQVVIQFFFSFENKDIKF